MDSTGPPSGAIMSRPSMSSHIVGIPTTYLTPAAEHGNHVEHGWLVDQAGVRWERAHSNAKRRRVKELLADPDLPVGVWSYHDGLWWIRHGCGEAVWQQRVAPGFGAPLGGSRRSPPPFHASTWRRSDTEPGTLLLFEFVD
jgi:hypothetical protein